MSPPFLCIRPSPSGFPNTGFLCPSPVLLEGHVERSFVLVWHEDVLCPPTPGRFVFLCLRSPTPSLVRWFPSPPASRKHGFAPSSVSLFRPFPSSSRPLPLSGNNFNYRLHRSPYRCFISLQWRRRSWTISRFVSCRLSSSSAEKKVERTLPPPGTASQPREIIRNESVTRAREGVRQWLGASVRLRRCERDRECVHGRERVS